MPSYAYGGDSLSYSQLERIVSACDRFEHAWRRGEGPRIETFLTEIDIHDALLERLMLIELDFRRGAGEDPSADEYRARFPRSRDVVEAVFAAEPIRNDGSDTDSERNSSSPPAGNASIQTEPDSTNAGFEQPEGNTETEVASFQSTKSHNRTPSNAARDDGEESSLQAPAGAGTVPPSIGRYFVLRRLGSGGFGTVYLARDDDLKRTVAIKVPHPQAFGSTRQAEEFLNEARIAAQFRHPAIVAVYDVGREQDGRIYIVLEYVDGMSLSEILKNGDYSLERLVEILARVGEAIHHAHKRGLVHRDLKPANILVDSEGNPRVADFGLAVRDDVHRLSSGEVAGTAPYMSPEQVQGETHRLDGRTDVWALGVTLYRVLTGRRPFSGNLEELIDEIRYREPKPPRQINDTIPKELERICLKCLSKRMTDRYSSALDLAEDLRAWMSKARSPLATGPGFTGRPPLDPESHAGPVRIGPKGLRAYEKSDAGSFLNLLPGPRSRDGLPESIVFWKTRIEDRTGETAFSIGLLYGPSGSGKSSLVKAGILPSLDESVRTVYVEASPGRTEARLLAALKRACPGLPAECGLVEATTALRAGDIVPKDAKLLLVIDQFEQWFHPHPDEPHRELVGALRQCDGRRLQALLLVRVDFWMAVTRFFRELDTPLIEGENSASVEPFDTAHARKVLVEFGFACGRLSDPSTDLAAGSDSSRFLDTALREMTGPDGHVTPVRISLFAEMVRRRPWTPATLRELGGIEGVGVTFLEETFCGRSAPPAHRTHERAAQAVLKSLLPEASSDLKGNQKAALALRHAAGYANRPGEFTELMKVLDNELRMVTSVDPDGIALAPSGPSPSPPETHYQLTHDYLVPTLRNWLTRKQRETRQGRVELRLATFSALWRDRPQGRHLPSLLEWLGILFYIPRRNWSPDDRRMMTAATRRHLSRAGLAIATGALLAFIGNFLREQERTKDLLDRVRGRDFRQFGDLLPEIDARRDALRRELERIEATAPPSSRDREVALILLFRDQPTPNRADALRAFLAGAGTDEVSLIRDALALHPAQSGRESLRLTLLDESAEPGTRLRVACVLSAIEPIPEETWDKLSVSLTHALLAEDRRTLPHWIGLLRPAPRALILELGKICRDSTSDSWTRATAAEALTEVLARQPDFVLLAQSVVESQPDASRVLLAYLAKLKEPAESRRYLRGVLDEKRTGRDRDGVARRQAVACIALAAVGEPDAIWPHLRHNDDPSLRSFLIEQLARADFLRQALIDRLQSSGVDPIERQAILLAWAETSVAGLPHATRTSVVELARKLYVDDPDSGVHSAGELLLKRWNEALILANALAQLRQAENRQSGKSWVLGPNGHTLAILRLRLPFRMGSPQGEEGQDSNEQAHYRLIDRTIAVATTEVTFEQFREFRLQKQLDRYARTSLCPVNAITWYDAAAYCNWLTLKAFTAKECCYAESVESGMTLLPDALVRRGYRLPTEAEFEYFCRADTVTSRPFGESAELLPNYAWTWLNSGDQIHPVAMLLPNTVGLFDVLGNVFEWCHDGLRAKGEYRPAPYPAGSIDNPANDADHPRETIDNKTYRYLRGGSYPYSPAFARSASRYAVSANLDDPYVGFRVVRTLPDQGN